MKRNLAFIIPIILLVFSACSKKPNPLPKAIVSGSIDQVRSLIAEGVDVDGKDIDGVPCLCLAVLSNQLDIVQALIDAGADVNAPNAVGWTPLMWAAQRGRADIVEALLKAKADVNKECPHGTPLSQAVKQGHKDIVVRLLDAGADVNFGHYAGNPLEDAITKRYWDVANILMDAGSKKGMDNLIISAIFAGHNEIVEKILTTNPDLVHDENAFYLACETGNNELVNLFLQRGATFTADSLCAAVRSGKMELVKKIIESGIGVNEIGNRAGLIPIVAAAGSGRPEIVRFLLEKGAKVNQTTSYGETALIAAAEREHTDIVRILLENGANVNAKTNQMYTAIVPNEYLWKNKDNKNIRRARERTALATALEYGRRPEIVELLLKNKADIPSYAIRDETVKGNLVTAGILLKYGANIDEYDPDGSTALLAAIEWNQPKSVKWLLDRKADFTLKDVNGRTPLSIAREKKIAEIEQLLLDAGAKE